MAKKILINDSHSFVLLSLLKGRKYYEYVTTDPLLCHELSQKNIFFNFVFVKICLELKIILLLLQRVHRQE